MSDHDPRIATDPETIVATVRERYGRLATVGGSCCGPSACCSGTTAASAISLGYDPSLIAELPAGVDLGLGCGAPVEHLALAPGETVLDLGSGAGIDVQIAARQVGPSGRAIGVDMTPEMLGAARRLAAEAGLVNAEFREGRLEALPVESASVDAVTSNCVINLVPDKTVVFHEIARVLKPGGRLVVSDIVLDGELPDLVRSSVTAWIGCIAGAMPRPEYFRALAEAGLGDVEILKDIDYLAVAGDTLPPEIAEAMAALGLSRGDLDGVVRSITYRAVKR